MTMRDLNLPESVVIYTGDDEWEALYVDGKLDRVGEPYLIAERIADIFGVEYKEADFFLGREGTYENVAATVAEIEAYAKNPTELDWSTTREVERLRAEAQRLLDEAERLAL